LGEIDGSEKGILSRLCQGEPNELIEKTPYPSMGVHIKKQRAMLTFPKKKKRSKEKKTTTCGAEYPQYLHAMAQTQKKKKNVFRLAEGGESHARDVCLS